MVKRRAVLLGASGLVVGGGGAVVYDRFGSSGGSMETGDDQGCRSGVSRRPQNGTLEFVNVVRFDAVEVTIDVTRSEAVDEIRVTTGGETLHTVSPVTDGRQKIEFTAENTSSFVLRALDDDGTEVDSAQFYSECAA